MEEISASSPVEARRFVGTFLVTIMLVLDEAASGLDWEREKSLTRLLQTLSDRGCTVVNVTHNLRQLGEFRRIVVVREGRVVFDGNPAKLGEQIPSGDLADVDLRAVGVVAVEDGGAPTLLAPENCSERGGGPSAFDQTGWLFKRELTLMGNSWCFRKRLVVPRIILPLFFASALACAVKPENTTMLGFLAILSCIWMGASLTLMAIVDEREVFDHERLLFLRIGPYVLTKALLGWLTALVQTFIFAALLTLLRLIAREADVPPNEPLVFHDWAWALTYLVLVAMAGAGMGLLISAIAGRHRPIANFLLPLAMIAQIVFSVQIAARDTAHEALEICYGEFHPHQCASRLHAKGRRAESWLPEISPQSGQPSATAAAGWLCSDCRSRNHLVDPQDDIRLDSMRPNLLATIASYLTISRYADIALRSFAYFADRPNDSERFGYRRWRFEACSALVAMAVGFLTATAALLLFQERLRPLHR